MKDDFLQAGVMMNLQFGRLMTAMMTPFDDNGALNIDEAIRIGEHLVETGTDTILLAGTTGESPTLTHDEEFLLFQTFVTHFKERVKIMAGTGSNSTATAIASTKKAEALGVDAVLQVVPYYNKPSQEGLYQHFKAISEASSLPILLYNIPGRTGINMAPETMARLAEIKTVFGVKEAAGDPEQVSAIRQATPDEFLIYSGDDGLTLSFMERGACGVVSVASHCAGAQIKAMMEAFVSGQADDAYTIQDRLKALFEVLFITSNPTPLKAAMSMMGFQAGVPRLPLVSATEEEYRQIEAVIQGLS